MTQSRVRISNYLFLLMDSIQKGKVGPIPYEMYSEEYKSAFRNLHSKVILEAVELLRDLDETGTALRASDSQKIQS